MKIVAIFYRVINYCVEQKNKIFVVYSKYLNFRNNISILFFICSLNDIIKNLSY